MSHSTRSWNASERWCSSSWETSWTTFSMITSVTTSTSTIFQAASDSWNVRRNESTRPRRSCTMTGPMSTNRVKKAIPGMTPKARPSAVPPTRMISAATSLSHGSRRMTSPESMALAAEVLAADGFLEVAGVDHRPEESDRHHQQQAQQEADALDEVAIRLERLAQPLEYGHQHRRWHEEDEGHRGHAPELGAQHAQRLVEDAPVGELALPRPVASTFDHDGPRSGTRGSLAHTEGHGGGG